MSDWQEAYREWLHNPTSIQPPTAEEIFKAGWDAALRPIGEPRTIRLRAYGNEIIERVLLAVENGRVVICTREEYETALREDREPTAISFRSEDVVWDEGATEKKSDV
jgi:hypothetical protein